MKKIKVSPFLHDIHGEDPFLLDIILTYLAGLFSVLTIFIISNHVDLKLIWWEWILLILISADIGAGIVANFTESTNKHYSRKPKARIVFIFSHIVHPAVFIFAIGNLSISDLQIVLYALCATFIINTIKGRMLQESLASFFILIGISMLVILKENSPLYFWFYSLYMVKLILAFAVRRHF